MTFSSTTQIRELKAAVVFYGRSPQPLDLVKNIQAPVLAHYGEKDPTVNQDIPSTEEAMKKYKKFYTYKIYPGAQRISYRYQSGTLPRRCGQRGLDENAGLF
jgi:dienelactone hydrolase